MSESEEPTFAERMAAVVEAINRILMPENLIRSAVVEYNRRMAEINNRTPVR